MRLQRRKQLEATEAVAAPQPGAAGEGTARKNIALFMAAPFLRLAYILAFPLVGLGMLA